MKNTAAAVTEVSRDSRQRITSMPRKYRPGTLTGLLTLALVFVFYMMLAMTFGIALGWGCILAAAGATAIAWTTCGRAAAAGRPQLAPMETRSAEDRMNPLRSGR